MNGIKLKLLTKDLVIKKFFGDSSVLVSGIVDDSRKVIDGSLFVAIKGLHIDSHNLIPQAIKNGAKVIVGEQAAKDKWIENATYIRVSNSRKALSHLVSEWYGNPSRKLKVIGVTGTDGKTTTVNLIFHILKKSGKKVGMVSTVDTRINNKIYETGLHVSNPEPLQLQKFLNKMVNEGCKYAVLEVTSHGLDQERTAGIDFDISLLTNITREHLDYHETMKNYIKTKTKLLNNSKVAIVNTEDENSLKALKYISNKVKLIDLKDFEINSQVMNSIVKRFSEKYNQENAYSAVAACSEIGINVNVISSAIRTFPGVEGRMQEIKNSRGIKIIIDFAHTPASVKKVLKELDAKTKGRLISIVSAEGNRDPNKRPLIAKQSCKIADVTILNPIDPRDEDPEKILKEMLSGAKSSKAIKYNENNGTSTKKYIGIIDRKEAIDTAINKIARKGDTIVLCGKGHEKSMAVKGKEFPWSDYEITKSILN